MAQLSAEQIGLLLTPLGQEAAGVAAALREPVQAREVARLRDAFGADLASAALTLAQLRRRARDRFRLAGQMYFDGAAALEQATSEPVARHKARRFAGVGTAADLCCGAGGDALAMAQEASRVIAVDRNAARLICLRAHAAVYGVQGRILPVAADVEQWIPQAEAYHIDPPRREEAGRRLRAREWSEWIGWVAALARRGAHVAGKFSPAIKLAALGWADEVEFISENGTLKQAVAWCGRMAQSKRCAAVIRSAGGAAVDMASLRSQQPSRTPEASGPLRPGQVLLEPDSAVVRAGLLGDLAERLGAALVDPRLALLACDVEPARTLLARRHRVLEVAPWSAKRVRQLARAHGWHVAEVKTRAFAGEPEGLMAQLRKARSRPQAEDVVLWAVRFGRRPMAIVTQRIASGEGQRTK